MDALSLVKQVIMVSRKPPALPVVMVPDYALEWNSNAMLLCNRRMRGFGLA